ncbi:DUF6128 domain-containing protein [Mediterraneibacter massiliensis]|uniref:DUF6128 domain-containing protein n=1 Tax=Mediterraneibacter massiliensis TaxID=1720300 RepID=UPI0024AD8304|nr:DUF6128 domain-containing protein [Mediterraneibacter massiliensis]
MNPGNCYLYEYENTHKVRNVGFFKITRHYHTCILQIQARGIKVRAQGKVDLYVFYQDSERSIAKKLTTLTCMEHSLSARISVSESIFPQGRTLENIDGFFLKAPPETLQTAPEKLWVVSHIVPKNIVPYDEPPTKAEPAAKPTGSTQTEVPVIESPTEEPDTVESETETPVTEPSQTEEPPAEERSAAEKLVTEPLQAEEPPTEERSAAEKLVTEPSQAEESATEELAVEEPAGENKQTENETKKTVSARKIQRSELCLLPKKFWFLANNSFLLHGYHNYNHLLLVEEDGHYWLGVPGIYDTHEARAASLFGFPQFTRSYTEILDLEDEERNDEADFGHWCRYIK